MTELSFFSVEGLKYRIEKHIIYRLMYCAVKIDFQDGGHGGHLGFLIGMILAIFLSTSHPDASYQLSSQLTFGSGIDFQDGHHFGFPIILAIFDLQVTPMLPTKFQVNWPFGSEDEANNRFSKMAATLDFRSERF